MATPGTSEFSRATDEQLRSAIQDADLPSLLPTLAFLRNDTALLRPEFGPRPNSLAHFTRRKGASLPKPKMWPGKPRWKR